MAEGMMTMNVLPMVDAMTTMSDLHTAAETMIMTIRVPLMAAERVVRIIEGATMVSPDVRNLAMVKSRRATVHLARMGGTTVAMSTAPAADLVAKRPQAMAALMNMAGPTVSSMVVVLVLVDKRSKRVMAREATDRVATKMIPPASELLEDEVTMTVKCLAGLAEVMMTMDEAKNMEDDAVEATSEMTMSIAIRCSELCSKKADLMTAMSTAMKVLELLKWPVMWPNQVNLTGIKHIA
jgi:hypothetical protein